MLPSRYEQPVSITQSELNEFDEVDNVIEVSIIMGEPDKAFEYGLSLKRSAAVKSYVLAKLLWKLKTNWETFGIDGDFEDVVFERIGTPSQTTKKYVRMWENIFANDEIPDATKKILMGRPIRDTLLLTAAAKEGMTPDELRRAALLPDQNAIREAIAEARGEQTSSSTALRIFLVTRKDRNDYPSGTLLAKRGNEGEYKPIGVLNIDDPDLDVSQAVARLTSVGVIEL